MAILESGSGMGFSSSAKVAEHRHCCKVIFGAPTALQGCEIEKKYDNGDMVHSYFTGVR